MNQVGRIIDKVMDFLENQVVAVTFGIVVIIVFVQVVFRELGLSLPWSEELARYLNTWTIYFGASKCVKMSKHLNVDLLPLLLKGKAKLIHAVLIDVLCFAFFAYVAYFGVQVLNEFLTYPQRSAALRVNMVYVYAAPVVGMFMMAIRTIEKIMEHIKGHKENNGGDAEAKEGAV